MPAWKCNQPESTSTSPAKPVSNIMKTAKSIIVVLFVLLTAQIASAYYCPSTGRWLSRDPIGEPGLQMTRIVRSVMGASQLAPSRWPSRDSIGEKGGVNLYAFVHNMTLNSYELLGLISGVITVPEPNPLPPFDTNHPENPSKKKVCRIMKVTRPGGTSNPHCIKCWKCTYQCSPPGIGGSTWIERWQIGGCLSVTGYVPGFEDPTDCEGATVNKRPFYPGETDSD